MNKNIFKLYFISILTTFFISCGGQNSNNSNTTEEEIPTIKTQSSNPENYKQYLWSLYENINKEFKKRYLINSNAHINISSAWNITKGKGVKVAVIDEDFEINHPEIKDKIIATYNAMDGSENISNNKSNSFSHGTATAGLIASTNFGVAPEVELILINLDLGEEKDGVISKGKATVVEINKAFDFAKEQGAQIISCSWSGNYVDESTKEKIEELKNSGIIFIFAAGNEGRELDLPHINSEAELNSVIGVGSSTVLNDVASYSNYGSNIDILAPGGGGKYNNSRLIGTLVLSKNNFLNSNTSNNYIFASGTSFSAPKVSGAIALLLSINPKLSFEQIRNILINTAQKVGKENGAIYIQGFNKRRAYGKIDVNSAIQEAINKSIK